MIEEVERVKVEILRDVIYEVELLGNIMEKF